MLSAFGPGATTRCVEACELAQGPTEEAPTKDAEADASVDVVPTHSAEECTKDLTEIRQVVEFLVGRERKLDVAVRRLERRGRGNDQLEEHEANLTEALEDRTKVVKLVVDKWFDDKGFGFGKVQSGEVVFIHASAVQGAEGPHDRPRRGSAGREGLGDAARGRKRWTRRGQAKWQSN